MSDKALLRSGPAKKAPPASPSTLGGVKRAMKDPAEKRLAPQSCTGGASASVAADTSGASQAGHLSAAPDGSLAASGIPTAPGKGGSDSLKRVLQAYTIAHAIPGRVRLRPRARAPYDSDALQALLEAAFPGSHISVAPKTGSILILLPLGTAGNATDTGSKSDTDNKPGGAALRKRQLQMSPPKTLAAREKKRAKAKAEQTDAPAVRNPIPGKVRSFLYPRGFVFASAVFRAVPYIFNGIRSLFTGRLTLDVLDGAALVVCLLQRDFRALSSITFFFALGEYLAEWTRKKSRASLAESLALNIEQVWIRADGTECLIPFADLAVGHQVIVRAGSAMPADGTVVAGEGMVNQASLTGEPLAVPKSQGATVYAGTVVEEGELIIEATKVGSGTRINAIITTIEESESVKASVQGKYERIADAIVPYNFLLSGAVYAATQSPMRAGSVLLVDYSCAIRLAAPLCVFTAMQEAASRGILIKGGKFMEAIAEADVLVFDKTGTLTNARPELVGVIPFGGRKRAAVLRIAACLEEHFAHPVGQAVVRASDAEGLKHREEHTKVEFIVAHGIASSWRGQRVLIGSAHFVLEDERVPIDPSQEELVSEESKKGRSVLYLAIGGELAGLLLIEDRIRDDARDVIARLKEDGVKRIVMLTGDGEETAASIAAQAGIDEYKAQMLPEDKAAFVSSLKREGCKVAMIGDGINDSPALSAAHVGVAMAEGADMAREVADIVLMSGRLDGLLVARRISREALRRIHGNFRSSLIWNSVFLAGGLLGLLRPGLSAFLHNATTAAIAVSSVRPLLPFDDGGDNGIQQQADNSLTQGA